MTKNKNCDINMWDILDRFSTVPKKVPQKRRKGNKKYE